MAKRFSLWGSQQGELNEFTRLGPNVGEMIGGSSPPSILFPAKFQKVRGYFAARVYQHLAKRFSTRDFVLNHLSGCKLHASIIRCRVYHKVPFRDASYCDMVRHCNNKMQKEIMRRSSEYPYRSY